jgi:putative peptidoglycan lipid II flippase
MRRLVRIRPVVDLKDPDLRVLLRSSVPVLIGTAAQSASNVVATMMASTLAVGSVTYVTNTTLLMQFFQGTFILGIATVLYPRFSKAAAEARHADLGEQATRSLGFLSIFLIPASTAAILLAPSLVATLFGHGAYGAADVAKTASTFLFFAPGLLFLGVRDVMSRVFYALGDTRTPMVNGLFAVAAGIALNLVLVPLLGLAGIGIAATAAVVVSATLLVVRLRARLGHLHLKGFLAELLRSIVVAVPTGAAAWLVQLVAVPRLGVLAGLALSLAACGAAYGAAVLLVRPACLEEYRVRLFRPR